jgi:hypothetical protein
MKKCPSCGGLLNSVGMCFPCDGSTIRLEEDTSRHSLSLSDQGDWGNLDNNTAEQVQELPPENTCPICLGYKGRFQACCSSCYEGG